MTFAEQLTVLRRQRGLSQEQLGDLIGVSRQAVSKWESGSTTPELEKLLALSDYFEISLDQLVGREPEVQAYAASVQSPEQTIEFHPKGRWGWHYEYKSKRTLCGMPLIHINLRDRGVCRAKGVIAIGNIATGLVAIGSICAGVLSFGCISAGILSLGALALGLLSIGGFSMGLFALGGIAIGIISIGGISIGIYAAGGCAIGAKIAVGDYAHAPVVFESQQQFRQAVSEHFPQTPRWLSRLFEWFGRH